MVDVRGEEDDALGNGWQDHSHDKYGTAAVSVRVRWQDKVAYEHTDQVARADQADILLWLTKQIEFLDPVINILGVGLVESE